MRRLCLVALLLSITVGVGAQPRHRLTSPNPIQNLVRVELRLTTDARFASVRVLGENFAAARGQRLVGPDNLRTAVLENLLPLSSNVEGQSATGAWRLVLREVAAGSTVQWFLNVQAGHRATLDIYNLNNESQPRLVDRFEGAVEETFTSSADQLRVGGPLPDPPERGPRMVLAYYYPWYERVTWTDPQMVDQPLRIYSNDDVADDKRTLEEAKQAGIDALIVNWQRENGRDGWNYRRLQILLQQAEQVGVKIALQTQPYIDLQTLGAHPLDAELITRWIDEIYAYFAGQPAFLRVDDRPVIFAYGWPFVDEAVWRAALDSERARGQNPFIVADTTDSSVHALADAMSSYADNIFVATDIDAFMRRVASGGRVFHLMGAAYGPPRLSIVTVSPGFDERALRDRPGRFYDRQNGEYYARQWAAALDVHPDWIVITSWNEWWENTEIEASQRYGEFYPRHTRAFADRFKASSLHEVIQHGYVD